MAKKFGSDDKAAVEMPMWEQLALSHMKMKPNPDGSLGHSLVSGVAADEWERYFRSKGMASKASFLRQRVNAGQGYMVPTQWPDEYDPTFRRRGTSWTDRSHPDRGKD